MEDLQRVLPAVVDKGVVAFEEYTGPEEDSPVSERANQALVYLGQTIPALFHSMGFTTAQFQVDIPYHDQEDPTAFTFLNTRGFAGTMDTAERIKHVQGVMDREIFPDLRRMGLEGGSLFFNVEVFGNTSIQYNLLFGSSYQGKRHFASYADALTSPLVADSRPSSLALSADLYAVINAAADATHNDDESDPFVIWEKPVAEIETKASAYLNTLPSMSERKPEPRARTEDEVRDEFLQAFRDKAHYWATTPNGGTVKERCDRVAFSILVMLDGGSGTMPAYRVTVDPAPEDKQYCIEKGVNYYEPGTEVTNGCLHELFYRGVSD
jgi:hypothetical protein